MIDKNAIIIGLFCAAFIIIFFYYGVSCGVQKAEKELRNQYTAALRNLDQYTAALRHLAIENDLMRKELVEIYKKYDIDLDARLKIQVTGKRGTDYGTPEDDFNLIAKVGNARAADVLSGKTFTNSDDGTEC